MQSVDNIIVPPRIRQTVIDQYGMYYSKISGVPCEKLASDVLNPQKALEQAEVLSCFTNLKGKSVLEIGSGFGINHITWRKMFEVDGFGVEPSGEGFGNSYDISCQLIKENGLDPTRVVDSVGECLPFQDNSFDIVYSANVLEHTQDPKQVIREALRVVKPGGLIQIIYPNYHSFYEGHYALFHPPIYSKSFFLWYLRFVGRDPSYGDTLRCELNYWWTKRTVNELSKEYPLNVISFGKEIFSERMDKLNFSGWAGLSKIKILLEATNKLRLNAVFSHILVFLGCHSPIVLTIRKQ